MRKIIDFKSLKKCNQCSNTNEIYPDCNSKNCPIWKRLKKSDLARIIYGDGFDK